MASALERMGKQKLQFLQTESENQKPGSNIFSQNSKHYINYFLCNVIISGLTTDTLSRKKANHLIWNEVMALLAHAS